MVTSAERRSFPPVDQPDSEAKLRKIEAYFKYVRGYVNNEHEIPQEAVEIIQSLIEYGAETIRVERQT